PLLPDRSARGHRIARRRRVARAPGRVDPCDAGLAASRRRRAQEGRMIPVRYNIRSLAVRKTTTVATALGIALVDFGLASSLMLAAGIKKTLGVSGGPRTAIVLRTGSDAELGSVIDAAEVNRILGGPGVSRDEGGKPVGTGEIIVVGAMEKIGAEGI